MSIFVARVSDKLMHSFDSKQSTLWDGGLHSAGIPDFFKKKKYRTYSIISVICLRGKFYVVKNNTWKFIDVQCRTLSECNRLENENAFCVFYRLNGVAVVNIIMTFGKIKLIALQKSTRAVRFPWLKKFPVNNIVPS